MILREPITGAAFKAAFPLLSALGLDYATAASAATGPDPLTSDARPENIKRLLRQREETIARWATPEHGAEFGPAIRMLNATLLDVAGRSGFSADIFAAFDHEASAAIGRLEKRTREASAEAAIAASLNTEATAVAAALRPRAGTRAALVLAAHDVHAARGAALCLGPDGLTGDPRAELAAGLDVVDDFARLCHSPPTELVDRLGPSMVRAVTTALAALAEQRADARIAAEHAAKVEAMRREELDAIEVSIAAPRSTSRTKARASS